MYHLHPGGESYGAGGDLVVQGAHDITSGDDEGDVGSSAGVGKVQVLRKETSACLNRVHPCFFGDADDLINVQESRARLFADTIQIRLVGLEAAHRKAVFLEKMP